MSVQQAKAPWWVALGLVLVMLVNLGGNLYWLDQNVVQIGRDASGHLERTAQIATLLETITPQTLFQALTFTDYRPPALYLAAQPFYGLLGRTMDSAQLTNVLLMTAILALTYLLASQVVSPAAALAMPSSRIVLKSGSTRPRRSSVVRFLLMPSRRRALMRAIS